jgi:hypothetical protein
MSSPIRGGGSRAPRTASNRKNSTPTPRKIVKPPAGASSTDVSPVPDSGNKRVVFVAGGGLGTVLTSSVAQVFDLVPPRFHPELDAGAIVVTALALAYILRRLIPTSGSVGFNWNFEK